LLAYCGLYCGGCRNYKGNGGEHSCLGCRDKKELLADCSTRVCASGLELAHCGQCRDFPCSQIEGFYQDGKRHHALALENIMEINKVGPDKWLEEQKCKHTCRCGARLTWFEIRKVILWAKPC